MVARLLAAHRVSLPGRKGAQRQSQTGFFAFHQPSPLSEGGPFSFLGAVMTKLLDDYLDDPGLAKELGRDERTIKRWRRQGVGPRCVRIGNEPYTHRTVVADWLKAGGTRQASRGRARAKAA
jgi:hypothetical protein